VNINFLTAIARAKIAVPELSREAAIQALAALSSSDSITVLIELLEDEAVAQAACEQLARTVYIFEAYSKVVEKYQQQHPWATQLLQRWAKKEWFIKKPPLPKSLRAIVFKMPGSVTAEMLSPAAAAWNRSNIPLHAQSLLCDVMPEAVGQMQSLKVTGYPIAFVVDRIDTQRERHSQRQSAVNALLWHIGEPMPAAPTQWHRGIVLSKQMDDAFYVLAENRGSLLLTVDTDSLHTGDVIDIQPYQYQLTLQNGLVIPFQTKRPAWQSIWRIGGRLAFALGNTLTRKAELCLENTSLSSPMITSAGKITEGSATIHYTLAQKIIGKACGMVGISPGTDCEPIVSVASLSGEASSEYDRSDPTTWKRHSAELVLQSHQEEALSYTEGITLKPRDGRIHAWMNRLLLPDSISVSHDRYTRCPLGMSLWGLPEEVHWAAVTGCFPMVMPESILVRFHGKQRPDIRLRDLIHAIPYFGLKKGLIKHQQDMGVFGNHILEIEGLSLLSVEEAYEFTESSVAYRAAACTIQLEETSVVATLYQNKEWLQQLIQNRYPHHLSLKRQLANMQRWLDNPYLLKPDIEATYKERLEIALEDIQEPLLASIQRPHEVYILSEVAQDDKVDAVWIGSTAIYLEHYRVVAKLLQQHPGRLKARLWLAPPSPFELKQLMQEGCYQIYGRAGVYTAMPEDVFCTQRLFKPGSVVVTTSLRGFIGGNHQDLKGYIASPELATMTAILGRLPKLSEYQMMLG
jgi:aconitate hydratase 2/2-methylisocitrate dehydratase